MTNYVESSQLAADERPDHEAQAEAHADEPHALGPLGWRGHVGDVGLGHGDVGGGEAAP